MDLSFYDSYQFYTDAELLQIINNAQEYMPAAVEAASRIARERNMSLRIYEEKPERPIMVQTAFDEGAGNGDSILGYLLEAPGRRQRILPWMRVLFIVVILIYSVQILFFGHKLYKAYIYLDWVYSAAWIRASVFLAFRIYTVVQSARRKRHGWILLIADLINSAVFVVFAIFRLVVNSTYVPASDLLFLCALLLLLLAVIAGLMQGAVCRVFDVGPKHRLTAILVGFGIALIFFGINYFGAPHIPI